MRKIYACLFVVIFWLVIGFQSDLGAIAESDLNMVLITNLNQVSQFQRQGLYRRSRQQLERLESK